MRRAESTDEDSFGDLGASAIGCFRATSSTQRMSPKGERQAHPEQRQRRAVVRLVRGLHYLGRPR